LLLGGGVLLGSRSLLGGLCRHRRLLLGRGSRLACVLGVSLLAVGLWLCGRNLCGSRFGILGIGHGRQRRRLGLGRRGCIAHRRIAGIGGGRHAAGGPARV